MTRMLLVLALVSACSKKSEPRDKAAPNAEAPAEVAPTTPGGSGSAAAPPASPPPASPPTGTPAEAGGDKAKLPCIVPAKLESIEAEGADVFKIAAGKDSTAPKGGTTATLRLPNPYHLSRAYIRLVGELKPGKIELRPVEGNATCVAEGCPLVEIMMEGATERAPSVSGTIVIDEADATRASGYISNVKVVEPREPSCSMIIEKLSFELDLERALTY